MQPAFVQCLRLVADGFCEIFSNATNYDKGEHLLIGKTKQQQKTFLFPSVSIVTNANEILHFQVIG